MEPRTEVLDDTLKQDSSVFNQGDNVVVGALDVARRVVKDGVDMNVDGFNSGPCKR